MSKPFHKLGFPEYEFRIRKNENKISIFDEIRKKWIICTPEEWVRQNLIKFLIKEYNYPTTLIAVEKGLKLAGRDYRFDVLVYSRDYKPLVIIECKAPEVPLSQSVFDQIWNYNYEIGAPYFLVTNGLGFIMGKVTKDNEIEYLDKPADYDELL
jgi:hypothetical protein